MFHDELGPVWDTLRNLEQRLKDAGIPHIYMGALALNAHDYRRSTEDVDVCMRREDLERFRREWIGNGYERTPGRPRRFVDASTRVSLDILVAGEIAGDSRRQQIVLFPDPDEAETRNDLPVPSLARLIELKLVTWRYKDWADVIELIRTHNLAESFADQMHPSVRSTYMQCYDQKVEEDRYNPEIHDAPPEDR